MVHRVLQKIASIGSPKFWQDWHAFWALIWFTFIPVAIFTSIKTSLMFLIFVSLMTAFSGEMAALHGVTVQRNQEET